MPKRNDIKTIMIIGSGPIVIGQGCEFDYSGTQAVRALKGEGFRVILVNSNPATIMTTPELADATYIEALEPDMVERIIEKEKPDALLPTMGGQTALNLVIKLEEKGVLKKHGIQLIGANIQAIKVAEDRELFQNAMKKIGLEVPRGGLASSVARAEEVLERTGLPAIIRPSFTLGGVGGSIVYNKQEFVEKIRWGLDRSPVGTVLIEEALNGWKEFELEVVRDSADQCVVICSIENFDPLGIHTGDSITVAPQQTLTDKEYQKMRDAAFSVIREVGVETGGSNIQFAVHPKTGRMVVIEMNPRVSRSSALASKATGFPIARIAAKLAVGYRLDELPNTITRKTPACFEPALDYVVVKIPKWTFEKFPSANQTLGSQMKSIGEVMSIGRSFPEALQKALRSLEDGRAGLGSDGKDVLESDKIEPHLLESWRSIVKHKLCTPKAENVFYIRYGFKLGLSVEEIHEVSGVDPWFLSQIQEMVEEEKSIKALLPEREVVLSDLRKKVSSKTLKKAKNMGFSDIQLATMLHTNEETIAKIREIYAIRPTFLSVDSCAAEFEAFTPYYYSAYEEGDSEVKESKKPSIMILGSGPNRIGQGIEFDFCCVQASLAVQNEGYDSVMVNCNPETVSTDYDISSRLYFEPITLENVLEICQEEKPDGIVVQFGGQTPLKIASELENRGVRVLGTKPSKIAESENRELFGKLLNSLKILHPKYGIATNYQETLTICEEVGYPVLVRPSFVLGGRSMEIIFDAIDMKRYLRDSVAEVTPEHPVLIDRYLEDAIEIDVDAVSDGENTVVCGIMQHIEEAGIHSGDSSCIFPPKDLPDSATNTLISTTKKLAKSLEVTGLMNVQFAYKNGKTYVIEVNPRASRTIPFISKATGINWVEVATRCILGENLEDIGEKENLNPGYYSVKSVVFPFNRFEGINPFPGPEMRSTGEVMGIAETVSEAYSKALYSAGIYLPKPGSGDIFISIHDEDKPAFLSIAKQLEKMGFNLLATKGTKAYLESYGVRCEFVYKVNEGRPNILDRMLNGDVVLLINRPLGRASMYDERIVGETAYRINIPIFTTLSATQAALDAIKNIGKKVLSPWCLQENKKTAPKC